jgi:hypothetical protein
VSTALLWALAASSPANAQTASPSPEASASPARGPTVSGQVSGALVRGSTLSLSVDASMPGGWEGLHLIEVAIVSGGSELEHLRFDIEDNKLLIGEQPIAVGTGAVATGEHLRVSGAKVVLTTGGGNLSFRIDADVVETIPEDARFSLSATDDLGATVQVSRTLAEPEGGGFTWATVVAFVAAALFAGGFVGNLFASKRRPPPRASVYGAVQRRLERDRASEGPAT